MTPRELQNSSQGLPKASIWTVRRALSHSFLFGRIGCKKPLLTKAHVKELIAWCKAYQNMTDDDCQNVVFTDECRFETFANRRRYVRRPIEMRYVNIYVCKTVKFPNSVMVWGGIKGDGTKTLVKCPHRLDFKGYQSILDEELFRICESESVFMQDGARCHKSRSTLQYLDQERYVSCSTGRHSRLISI